MGLTASVDTRAWQQLVMEGRIHLGGIGHTATPTPTTTALVRLLLASIFATTTCNVTYFT